MLGSYLGEGLLYSEVKEKQMKDITVEGAELSFEIFELVKNKFNLKQMPLMLSVMESVVENKKILGILSMRDLYDYAHSELQDSLKKHQEFMFGTGYGS